MISKKPWPTEDAMAQVYDKNLWGGEDVDFYSGDGSHDPALLDPYVQAVIAFLTSFEEPLVVCDLGCGDFNVGRSFVEYSKKYIAVDIVPELIERNKTKFTHENLEFYCRDIANHEFPSGDCAILRNVLQHISNAEIQEIISKLYNFQNLIVTEHVPEEDFIPNKDIISGQGIRLKKGSGVDLLAPPFNIEVKEHREWLTLPYGKGAGLVITTLYSL
ncbi:MAG: class I SAM-dependent methyltransferase [Gracilimonas sp.]|jgi:hypothetical protein|nr:class I SAM-dependent methyltransferase [Gracilimonas sp.]